MFRSAFRGVFHNGLYIKIKAGFFKKTMTQNIKASSAEMGKIRLMSQHWTGHHNHPTSIQPKMFGVRQKDSFSYLQKIAAFVGLYHTQNTINLIKNMSGDTNPL